MSVQVRKPNRIKNSKTANGYREIVPKPSGEGHTSFTRAERRRIKFNR